MRPLPGAPHPAPRGAIVPSTSLQTEGGRLSGIEDGEGGPGAASQVQMLILHTQGKKNNNYYYYYNYNYNYNKEDYHINSTPCVGLQAFRQHHEEGKPIMSF